MTVLLWGMPSEETLASVESALSEAGTPTFFLDQRASLLTELDLEVGETVTGTLRVQGRSLDLASVTAAYVRPFDGRNLPWIAAAGTGSPDYRHVVALEAAMWTWADLAPSFVLSRPSAMASNGSKPYQLELILRLGWDVPATLVTTDAAAVEAFWEKHGAVIYKSVSGVGSKVARLGPEHRGRLSDLAACPTQFQEHIRGVDHRVHVVGDAALACEVRCDADDYRQPGAHPLTLRACELPPEIAARCVALAAALRLPLAGIDLRRTPDDRWYCFEVNTSPGFAYYEAAAGQPIGAAVARLLAGGCASRSG